jgi:hypothetical protein
VIEVQVTDEQLIEARKQAVEMGKLHNSITRGQGNVAGFVGEIITAEILNGVQDNTFDYDIFLPKTGKTVDVKTKRTSVAPLPHYECSVAKLNTNQNCDFYAFVRVKNDYSTAWFLGMVPKVMYYEMAVFRKKGDLDPDNGYIVKSDCYNLPIKDLWEASVHEISS